MPGFVATERMAAELAEFGFDASKGLPTDNPGRVCAMLATADDPMLFSGHDVYGPRSTPSTRGPASRPSPVRTARG